MELHKIKYLLTQVQSLNLRYEKINQQSGENFNIFKILQLHASEVRLHSTFLAELLNPSGSHGQKELFLNLFVSQFATQDKNFEPIGAYVEVEKYVGLINEDKTKGGRIDIIITDSKGKHIIIENKIYAPDQEKQLIRYKNYSKLSDILYLTLDGKKPGEVSCRGLEEGHDYNCISYKDDISKWRKLCIKEVALNPIIRESLIQYLHLIKYLNNQTINLAMTEELSGLINSNLEAAFTVHSNLKTATQLLLKKLKTDVLSLEEEFKSAGYSCKYYVDFNKAYSSFRFIKKDSEFASITFQFGEYGRFFTYGIASLNDPTVKPIEPKIRSSLEDLVGLTTKEAWWPVKFQFESPYNKNWDVSFEPWEAIETGKLKEVIREKIKFMINLLGDIQL